MLLFKKSSAFTLAEIIVYFGLFSLIIVIVYPMLTEVFKNLFILRENIDLQAEVRNLILNIQNELYTSKDIEILTDWEIVFLKKNERSAIFLTKPIYLDISSSKIKGLANNLSIGSISFFGPTYGVNFSSSSSCLINSSTVISSKYTFSGYAWSPQIGWLKFRNTDSGEPVYGVCLDNNNEFRGYAWNDVIGWISFNCQDVNICQTSNYKVIARDNYLYGYAWNEVVGWLIFDGRAGKAYLAKMNPNIYYLGSISNPQIFIEDLSFSKLGQGIKIKIKTKTSAGSYEETEAFIIPPFK